MDAQGVSRDEAMCSGLVPITSRVAAVPEFVDEQCGFLAPEEDHRAIADAIRLLHADPALFLRLSEAAARRVRSQSGFEQTIQREIALIDA
jgi:glycosyltransferase involved in cell wall biosynthesis